MHVSSLVIFETFISGSQPDAWGVSPGPQSSPWGSPAPPQQTAGLDPFGSPAAPTTTTNGTNNIDEAFDLLSSRSTEGSPAKSAGSSAAQAFDPLGWWSFVALQGQT